MMGGGAGRRRGGVGGRDEERKEIGEIVVRRRRESERPARMKIKNCARAILIREESRSIKGQEVIR